MFLLLGRIEARRRVEFTSVELVHGAKLAAPWRRTRRVAPMGREREAIGMAYWSSLVGVMIPRVSQGID